MIIDIFPFFNEFEILKIRLEELYNFVDKFVIVENNYSFRGNKKEYNFENHKFLYKEYLDKIEYLKISKIGHEDIHKNSALESNTLKNVSETDLILFGDVDEIPNSLRINEIKELNSEIITFHNKMFLYRLNGLVKNQYGLNFDWYGTVCFKPNLLTNFSLTQIRDKLRGNGLILTDSGWHFTSIGTNQQILDKFLNWGHWSEIQPSIEYINECINNGKHFHPNCQNLKIDYQKHLNFLPLYVQNHLHEFNHLIKKEYF